jgi:HEAT repeat protein
MSRLTVAVLGLGFLLAACDDPKDAKTWIKKLRNPEHATEAVKQLEKIGDAAAVQPLCDLYKDFESPTILKAIISFKDKRAIPTLIKALDFTEDKYHNATMASKALANLKAVEAVDALCKVVERPMAIKSRANLAKISAIEALADLGDKKAVPCLINALEKRPEEQDFFVNKKAAFALGEIGDPAAVPVLIRALFMASTIQGPSYPMANVALVKIGDPSIKPLINALQGKDEKLNAMGKALEFKEGVVVQKVCWVLGDMIATEAVPALLEIFKKAKLEVEDDDIKGLDGVITALGQIGDESAVDPLIKGLSNKKANYKLRMQIAQALTVMGPKKALPALIDATEKGYVNMDGTDFTNLNEGAAMAFGRIVGAEAEKYYEKIQTISKDKRLKADETQKLFKEVLERMEMAKECKDESACYGKKINDESLSLVKREKAGIMIGILPDGRKALPDLVKALNIREPVLRLYYLAAAKKIGNSGDAEMMKTLQTLYDRDSKRTVKALGADLAREDAVTLAVVRRKKASAEK